MSETKLLPCPFCGGSDLCVIKMMSEDEPVREYARAIRCRDCHAHGRHAFRIGWTESDVAATEGWNCRALTPKQEAAEEMFEALNEAAMGVLSDAGGGNVALLFPVETWDKIEAALAKAGRA